MEARRQRWQCRNDRLHGALVPEDLVDHATLQVIQRDPALQGSLLIVRGKGRVGDRERTHEGSAIASLIPEEDQRRECLVDGDAQNFAESGKTGRRGIRKKGGLPKHRTIPQTTQYAVVKQHGQGLALSDHELLPVALRRGNEVIDLEQMQAVAKLELAEDD